MFIYFILSHLHLKFESILSYFDPALSIRTKREEHGYLILSRLALPYRLFSYLSLSHRLVF